MKNEMTLKEFKQKYQDSYNYQQISMFLINCSLDDFIAFFKEPWEKFGVDVESNESLSDFLSHFNKPLKFKLNVKFKDNDIYKEIILFFDSYRITLHHNSNESLDKGKTKYTIENIRKRENTLTEKLYSLIVEKYSLNNPITLREGSYYEHSDDTAFYEAYKALIIILENNLINDSNWINLNNKSKRKLFLNAIFLHMQLNTAIYSTLSRFLDNSFHFGPVRETPKYIYKLKNNKFDKNEYYALLNKIPIKDDFQGLLDLDSFLRDSKIGKKIFTELKNREGKIKFILNNNTIIDLADAPSGLIQLFPILCKLSSNRRTYSEFVRERFSIEQPELHLHPKLQTKLTEFLVDKTNLLIETHSEHIIKKLQVMFAEGEIFDDGVIINYFENKNGKTRVKKMELEENGFFKEPWPDGFFDEGINLTKKLLFTHRKN